MEGLSEQLRLGTIKVRDIVGEDAGITNQFIEDSLWHYYYDIDKTVNYLLSKCKFAVFDSNVY